MKEIAGGTVTSALGFKANAVCAGIRRTPDLALIYSVIPAKAAGVFTRNRVKAAHVLIDRQNLKDSRAQAVIVNSGNANCCTGRRGRQDAVRIISALAKRLGLEKEDVLIASTGVIGKFLAADKIIRAVPALADGLDFNRGTAAAQAIMTTDTFTKQSAVQITSGGRKITIAAMAKGAGMICPDMATMLAFITTDADIETGGLKQALRQAAGRSFNRISVDGEMSTNDSVIILANGLAGNARLKPGTSDYKEFGRALDHVCAVLAKMIVRDGEGATKVIEVCVRGARTANDAKKAAAAAADSLLVKTMISGSNPNWGRIAAAAGASGAYFREEKLELFIQGKAVYRRGRPVNISRDVLVNALKRKDVLLEINLNAGKFGHTVWASDLTKEYVRINAEYN